ncbi:hypothetical protein MMC30_000989 [Trapelia coarctata]|nr:hypothetical protein [Trapelia coarctata]
MASSTPGNATASRIADFPCFIRTLYQSTIAAYDTFTTACPADGAASIVQAQFLVHELWLKRWGDSVGLTKREDDLDGRLKSETGFSSAVTAALVNLKFLLLDMEDIKKQYGVHIINDLPEQDHLLSEHENRRQGMEATFENPSLVKKLCLASKEKGEEINAFVVQLAKFNHGLHSLMPPLEARVLAKSVTAELLRTTDLEKLLILRLAFQDLDPDMASLVQLRYRSLGAARHPNRMPVMELPNSSAGLTVCKTALTKQRSIGTYISPVMIPARLWNVMIEWKYFDPDIGAEEKTLLEKKVTSLAYFLSQAKKPCGLCSFSCVGFTRATVDTAGHFKYGLVYVVSDFTPNSILPTSLSDILPKDAKDWGAMKFSLGGRFNLACSLAECVYNLHVSNWLHKDICSDNVLFVPPWPKPLSKPSHPSVCLILAGYDIACSKRLKDSTQKAESANINAYAHPVYRNGEVKYCRLFDIYSLGVILLEIGLWRRVETGVVGATATEVRETLIRICENRLEFTMGVLYRNVVLRCLKGDFAVEGLEIEEIEEPRWEEMREEEVKAAQARDERVNCELATAFYWKVVKVLATLNA